MNIQVSDPLPVKVRGAEDWDGCMAISICERTGEAALRAFSEAGPTGLRESVILRATQIDALRFVVEKEPWVSPGEQIVGQTHAVEDPTIFWINDNRYMAFTDAVKPISTTRQYAMYPLGMQGDHHASLRVVDPHGNVCDMLSPESMTNHVGGRLNTVKEIEVISASGQRVALFEGGGPWVRSQIWTGRIGYDMLIKDIIPVWVLGPNHLAWYKDATSTGPIVTLGSNDYLMFFNGKGERKDRRGRIIHEWAVGAARFHIAGNRPVFDEVLRRPVVRDRTKLAGYEGQIICFASSVAEVELFGNCVSGRLYAHIGDLAICVYRFVINL